MQGGSPVLEVTTALQGDRSWGLSLAMLSGNDYTGA